MVFRRSSRRNSSSSCSRNSRSSSNSSCSQFFAKIFYSFSRVSEATLDTFLVRFSDEFVLQGHGVSPSGRVVWPCLCAAEAAAAAVVLQSFSGMGNTSSSSSSRPSVAWCFARAAGGTAAAAAAAAVETAAVAATAAVANFLQRFSILFLGFQKQR